MNSDAEVETVANSELQQDVREEWDGLTVLHPNMADQNAGSNRCSIYSTRCTWISGRDSGMCWI